MTFLAMGFQYRFSLLRVLTWADLPVAKEPHGHATHYHRGVVPFLRMDALHRAAILSLDLTETPTMWYVSIYRINRWRLSSLFGKFYLFFSKKSRSRVAQARVTS